MEPSRENPKISKTCHSADLKFFKASRCVYRGHSDYHNFNNPVSDSRNAYNKPEAVTTFINLPSCIKIGSGTCFTLQIGQLLIIDSIDNFVVMNLLPAGYLWQLPEGM